MIFEHPFFTQMLLPFLLVFIVVFAILQKSKVLGDGKAQIDSLAALVIGLITITFAYQTGIIVRLMGWLAVGVAVILVFLILYGFVAGDLSKTPDWMKITFGILAGLFTIGVIIYVTDLKTIFMGWFEGAGKDGVLMNIILVALVAGAVITTVATSKKKDKKD
jgi:hypothetical protein